LIQPNVLAYIFALNGRTPMVLANLALGVISTAEPGPSTPSGLGGPTKLSTAEALPEPGFAVA
jgi:hypothetical protein